jgi:hypothetical protein
MSTKNKSMTYKSFSEAFAAHRDEIRVQGYGKHVPKGYCIPKVKPTFSEPVAISVTIGIDAAVVTKQGKIKLFRRNDTTPSTPFRTMYLSERDIKTYFKPHHHMVEAKGRRQINRLVTAMGVR